MKRNGPAGFQTLKRRSLVSTHYGGLVSLELSPPGKHGVFRRHLRDDFLFLLQTHPTALAMIDAGRSDPDLDVRLRGTKVDIYFHGYVVFRIGSNGSLQVGSAARDKGEGFPRRLNEVTPGQVEALINRLKALRQEQYLAKSENSFESKFIANNQTMDSAIEVIDRQIVHPGEGLRRIDLLLADTDTGRLVLAELKLEDNPEIRSKVFRQLADYRDLFARRPAIQEDYVRVFEQLRILNLTNGAETIDVSGPPLLALLIGGHPDTSYRSSMSPIAIRNAARKKRDSHPELDVHTHYWPNFQSQDLLLAKPLRALPRFEEWASS